MDLVLRFIPAPAGNAGRQRRHCKASTVHPRACGERVVQADDSPLYTGSSPRLRGTPRHHRPSAAENRFIPAPAGNAAAVAHDGLHPPVHPRACGERHRGGKIGRGLDGSSPRLRGTRVSRRRAGGCGRFIPAPAGNAFSQPKRASPIAVHPRACGERRCPKYMRCYIYGSSPRLRGTLRLLKFPLLVKRFIPAPAGNARP